MKVALICPSNIQFMPYVSHYVEIVKDLGNVEYDIISWNRFHIEGLNNLFAYKDSKVGHQRNFYDYYKYQLFIKRLLYLNGYDKIIVFGVQLTFFLKDILLKNFRGKYIIDIRDYNKIINYMNMKRIINYSYNTVISSEEYKKWLPTSDKYIIDPNTKVDNIELLSHQPVCKLRPNEKIDIAYIGSLRDLDININLISSIKNSNIFNLYYHGEGPINNELKKYIKSNEVENVNLSGRYDNVEEEILFRKSDIINVLIPNTHINNKTLLPNRLYNAALYGKPIIAFEGTYLAKITQKYNLGIVLNSFESTNDELLNLIRKFDKSNYEDGRNLFFKEVIKEKENFKGKLKRFLN